MMKYNLFGLSVVLLAGCTSQETTSSVAQKNTAVPEKVQICVACHGVDGKHGKENVPSLGGRSYEELVVAMQRVKEAYSPQPLLGHALSDEDMHDIATYFSSFQ
jgi:cytochrome c553